MNYELVTMNYYQGSFYEEAVCGGQLEDEYGQPQQRKSG